ncbi:MAG: UDP-N-acetylmuramoyl-tripeptide--D-alanyl-D-alanine ligase [Candidatus Brocadiia bacterium]|nr:UDP-N-acetylmuramoyl-tripeptide--D-alanyl-D-alanine ligase [Candidatus Brocadiia bacterium]
MKSKTKFTAGAIARACRGRLVAGSESKRAAAVSIDSRTIAPGQAFVAIRGARHDGHQYVPDAARAGASVLVVERAEGAGCLGTGRLGAWALRRDVAVVQVEDTTRALVDLAAWHRMRLGGTVLAVTGSCGKSTVKAMLAAILGRTGRCAAAQKSFNNRIGMSLTLLNADVEDEFVVLEMGTNHPGEIDELARCARPHVGVITCIGDAHLQGLGDRHGVREAKAELIPHLAHDGLLLLNADDRMCMSLAKRFEGEVRTFGFSGAADVRPADVRREAGCMAFEFGGREFRLPFAGRHNVVNAAAALGAATWAGADLDGARDSLAEVSLPSLRQQVRRIENVTFVEDCYNSNPTAMRAAVAAFLEEPVQGRRVVVCGDMLELGPRSPEMHVEVGRMLAFGGVDLLVAVGPMGVFLLEGWNSLARDDQSATHYLTAEDAWRPLWENLKAGDGVLLKGSRLMGLERITEEIDEHIESEERAAA